MLYFDICEEVLLQFSQRFFRSYLFYGYIGLSRDLVANIRIRFIACLPLVRHCLRVPVDNMLLSKLIDSTESLAVRDSDGGVVMAMNQFHSKHGLLHSPECCQSPNREDSFGAFEPDQKKTSKRSVSTESLTDEYLVYQIAWESLDSMQEDKAKEEAEQKLLFFQLDPGKKKEVLSGKPFLKHPDLAKRSYARPPVFKSPAVRKPSGAMVVPIARPVVSRKGRKRRLTHRFPRLVSGIDEFGAIAPGLRGRQVAGVRYQKGKASQSACRRRAGKTTATHLGAPNNKVGGDPLKVTAGCI